MLAAAARPILGVTWLRALLLASIVASTDGLQGPRAESARRLEQVEPDARPIRRDGLEEENPLASPSRCRMIGLGRSCEKAAG